MSPTRKYRSPLREAQAHETRERILSAATELLGRNPIGDFSMDEIATAAGVERRTVFRHFSNKEALLDALWGFVNEQLEAQPRPSSFDELVSGPRTAFPAFDRNAGIMRASLHTPAGQAMRLRAVPARRAAFHACLADELKQISAKEAEKIEALAHLLYSAGAWETLKDYAGMDGETAGEAASWAIKTLVDAVIAKNKS
ncbi:MAG: TetR/AcrR family transcriptional regulator [Hydrogenophaga sp.]|nr:TetR/AcrR family transcriptional regulator [Hydrogenophaga sp.]